MIVFSSEGILILAGNCLTLFIFQKIRKTLRRTSYLLINLTAADLILSLSVVLYLWSDIAITQGKPISVHVADTAYVIDILASAASVLSLSLISLERMFAILWPFRHRILQTWHYVVSLSFLWVIVIANATVSSYLVFSNNLRHATIGTVVIALVSLLVTVTAYLVIWVATKRNQLKNSRSMAQQKRLAKTLCIVTIISLITWLPTPIGLAIPTYLRDSNLLYVRVTLALQYANSFLNPVVYCFRMPEFKKILKDDRPLLSLSLQNKAFRGFASVVSAEISLNIFKSTDSKISPN